MGERCIMKLTKEKAKEVINSTQMFAERIQNYNIRIEVQRRLDLMINNYFGPESEHMTELLLSNDISLYTGGNGDKGFPLFFKDEVAVPHPYVHGRNTIDSKRI